MWAKRGAMSEIVPVIFCGGVGARLWPLSRKSLPKQFAPLFSDKSLFEASVAVKISGCY
jgi:mannose-1-phosphate guanylyltransferase